MAQRRMFSKDITSSDLFVDMPASSQLLYFQLGMEADDEGFIGNARMLSRAYGANNDDLKLLQAKGLIIVFDSGVTVVKDWKINNQIRKDRFKPTIYTEEKSQLTLTESGSYQLGDTLATKWQPNDNQLGDTLATQYRIGKVSQGKVSQGKVSADEGDWQPSSILKNVSDYYQQEIGVLSPNQYEQLSDFVKIDGFDYEVIKRAIDKSANSAKRSFGYVSGILRGWRQNGIKTLVQVEDEQRRFVESKTKTYQKSEQGDGYDPDLGF